MLFIECKKNASLPSEFVYSLRSNKRFKRTANAWHFRFAVIIVFKAQCGSFCIALSAA
ncbi:DUF3265 domain-containing protein [Vibrio sp. S9_S30]|nr:DUF3265 domain-containing protein [Vibrio sp. S9_S30]